MLKNNGMTLIETLLAFSIFITTVTVVFSSYVKGFKHYEKKNQEYMEYVINQKEKEQNLWQTNDLYSSINEVLR